ncbi:MAG: sugar transferase [Clostridia bacterium]|nr:sugar transferase [Clostridia bacterium]
MNDKKGTKSVCFLGAKRLFDVLFSLFALIVLCLPFLLIALAIKIDDGGKVFYTQERIGKGGKRFKLYKFRSMIEDADRMEETLSKQEREEYKAEYKLRNDARITRVGMFLRKTSMDELPNLFSVLKGDISIVGPRPLLEEEAYEKFGEDVNKLLSMKPGIVGMWAVNGRNNLTYESGKRQEMELYYIDHCSVWLDIKIIAKAIVSVLKQEGAK